MFFCFIIVIFFQTIDPAAGLIRRMAARRTCVCAANGGGDFAQNNFLRIFVPHLILNTKNRRFCFRKCAREQAFSNKSGLALTRPRNQKPL